MYICFPFLSIFLKWLESIPAGLPYTRLHKNLYLSMLVLTTCMAMVFWPTLAAALEKQSSKTPQRQLTELESHYMKSVLRGWRSFQTSYAEDGMACVHCHLEHDSMRTWVGSYPKVQVFDGKPYRVKGLRQVVLETLDKHTDLPADHRSELAEDLVAYIAWWGDGQSVKPGHSKSIPPAQRDLATLKKSVEKGQQLFLREADVPCGRCHSIGKNKSAHDMIPLTNSVTIFPRYMESSGRVISLEAFLAGHLSETSGKEYGPESAMVTDLIAYMASMAQGKKLRPGSK